VIEQIEKKIIFGNTCVYNKFFSQHNTQNIKIKIIFFHQLKRGYALNLSILVSAAQKQKLTRIPLVTASESGNTENNKLLVYCISSM